MAAVQQSLADALGVAFPHAADDVGRSERLRAAFRQQPHVVVLDDIRPDFIPSLRFCLPPCPPCAVLITSRQHEIGLPAGAMHALDVMTDTQALDLLRGAGLAEAIAQEPEAAAALAVLCAFHPLALDLAARRLLRRMRGSTPIAAFNREFRDRLATLNLTEGDPRASLRANFDWSYSSLSPGDQVRFRRLAIFAPTGFGPHDAAAVWAEVHAQ